jgi:hypothetical protein
LVSPKYNNKDLPEGFDPKEINVIDMAGVYE